LIDITYSRDWLGADLARYLSPAAHADVTFAGRHPADFLAARPPTLLRAWMNTDGDNNLYNSNNWSPTGSPDRDDWVFDDTAPGGGTQAVFGAGTPG
jgi:hypothetical protein